MEVLKLRVATPLCKLSKLLRPQSCCWRGCLVRTFPAAGTQSFTYLCVNLVKNRNSSPCSPTEQLLMKHKSIFQSKAERAEHGVAPPGTRHSATCLAPRPVTVIVGDPAAWGSQRQLSWGPKRPGAFFSREPRQDSWGQAPAERSRERPGARVGATSAAGGGGVLTLCKWHTVLGLQAKDTGSRQSSSSRRLAHAMGLPACRCPRWLSLSPTAPAWAPASFPPSPSFSRKTGLLQ